MGQNALNEGRSFNQYYNLQALLTYQKKFGEHNLDILAGYQQENEKWDNIGAYRDGFPTDILHVLNAGSKENWSNSGYATHWAIASFIGSLNYDYASKYLLSLKMRSDGSSRLASGNRWSTFPSVSAAWRISSESFMEKTQIFERFENSRFVGFDGCDDRCRSLSELFDYWFWKCCFGQSVHLVGLLERTW